MASTYEYWTLVESVRTAAGPRQRTVATLGKLPGLDDETRVGWEHVAETFSTARLHQQDFLKPAEPDPPQVGHGRISRVVSVERLRRFGAVYLGLALWRRLRPGPLLQQRQWSRAAKKSPGRRWPAS